MGLRLLWYPLRYVGRGVEWNAHLTGPAAPFTSPRLLSCRSIGLNSSEGISGGEKRRLAMGLQLIGLETPSIIFLDEPTSGLDSHQALQVVALWGHRGANSKFNESRNNPRGCPD